MTRVLDNRNIISGQNYGGTSKHSEGPQYMNWIDVTTYQQMNRLKLFNDLIEVLNSHRLRS